MYGYAHPIHVESADETRFFAQAVWQLGGVRENGNRRQEIELIRLVGPISATSRAVSPECLSDRRRWSQPQWRRRRSAGPRSGSGFESDAPCVAVAPRRHAGPITARS